MKGISRILIAVVVLTLTSRHQLYSQLNGTYNIPVDYPNLASAISALNTLGVNGPVVITINAGYTETAPVGGYTLTASGTSVNTITFQRIGIGNNPLITAYAGGTRTPGTAVQDGIWHIIGSDYITINGIDLQDFNGANPATMEYGFGFFKANSADGCQNNTIINCTVSLNRVNNAAGAGPAADGSRGINVVNSLIGSQTTVLTVTASSGSHSNNRFYSNTIQNCNIGIALIGYAAPSPFSLADTNNDIGGNSSSDGNQILNFGGGAALSPAAGIRTLAQYGLNVAYNIVNNNNGSGVNHATTLRGIYLNTAQSANVSVRNNTLTLTGASTNAQVAVIENLAGATAASNSVVIDNNLIVNCSNTNNINGAFYAIYNNAATASYLSVSGNTFSNNSLFSANGSAFYVYNNAAVTNVIRFNSNTIAGCTNSASTTGLNYFLYNNANSAASFEACSNTFSNNLNVSNSGPSYIIFNALPTAGNITFTNNLISGNTYSTVSGNFFGVQNAGTSNGNIELSNNTYANNTVSGASGAVFSIYNTGTTSGYTEMSNNLFNSENVTISTTGSYFGIYNNAASASTLIIGNNQFQNDQYTAGSGSVHLIYNRGPITTTFALNSIDYNSISSCTFNSASSSPFLGIYNSLLSSGILSISNNSLTNLSWNSSGATKFLIQNNGVVNNSLNINNNTISACSNTLNTTGGFYGVYNTGPCNGDLVIQNNVFNLLSGTASSGVTALIFNNCSVSGIRSFTNNVFTDCLFSASGTGDFNAIYNFGNNSTRIDLAANTFSNLSIQRFTGASYLIQNTGPIATTIGTVNIKDNTIANYTGNFLSGGSFFALYNNGVSAQVLNISTNTFVNSVNTVSTGANHLVYNRGTLSNTFSSVAFQNNSISNFTFNANGNGSFFGLYNNGVSVVDLNIGSNTLSTSYFTSSVSARYMVFNSGSASGSVQLIGNEFSSLNGTNNTTGVFYFINNAAGSALGTQLINNRIVSAQLNSSTGDIYGIRNGGVSTAAVQMRDNLFQNLTAQHTAGGVFYGLLNDAVSCSTLSIADNTITSCARQSANGANYWIYARGTGATVINRSELHSNYLTNLTHNVTGNGAQYGIWSGGGTLNELSIMSNSLDAMVWTSVNANRFLIANTSLVNNSTQIQSNLSNGITSTLNTSAGFYGIYNAVSPSNGQLAIVSNTLQNLYLSSNSGPVQLVSSSGTQSAGVNINSNTIRNYTVNTSGSGEIIGINNNSSSTVLISLSSNTLSNALLSHSTGSVCDVYNSASSSNSILLEQNNIHNQLSTASGGGAKFAIYNNAASCSDLSISSNTISNLQRTSVNGAVHFVYNRGTITTTFNLVALNNNYLDGCSVNTGTALPNLNYVIFNNGVRNSSLSISSNTINNFSWQTYTSDRYLIYNTSTSSLGISLQNNVLQNHASPLNSTGAFYGIYNNSPNSAVLNLDFNLIDQIQSQSTTGRKYLIINGGNLSNSVSISSNTLSNCSILSTTNTSFFGIHNTPQNANLHQISANVILNNALSTGNGTMGLIFNTGLSTNTVNLISISNNLLSGNTHSASLNGPFFGISNTTIFSNSLSILSNQIANHNSPLTGSNRFMYYNTGGASSLISIRQNSLSNITYTNATTGSFFGINNGGASSGTLEVAGNTFDQLHLSSSTGTSYAIYNNGAVAGSRIFDGNTISSLTFSSSTLGTCYGLFNQSGNSQFLSMNSNSLTNTSITTRSVSIYLIHNTGLATTTVNTIQINNNIITGGLHRIDTLAAFYGVFNNLVNTQLLSLNNNNFNNHVLNVQQGLRFLVYNTGRSTVMTAMNGNQFNGCSYQDSLSNAFYGVYNVGTFSAQLQMNANTYTGCTIATKTASLHLICNAAITGTNLNQAQLNGNGISGNTFSITQNRPFYMVYQNGDAINSVQMNNNQITTNTVFVPFGNTYMVYNSGPVTSVLNADANAISQNDFTGDITGDWFGVYNSAEVTQSLSISSNTVMANKSAHVSGNTQLIYNSGLVNSLISLNNNSLGHVFTNSLQPYIGVFNGIWSSQSSTNTQVGINGNVFSALTFSTITGLGPLYFIRTTSDPSQLNINNNLFNSLQLRNAGAHYFMHNTGNVQNSLTVHSNTLSSYLRQFSGSADLYFYYANAQNVPAVCVQSFSANLITNVSSSVSGVGGFYGIYSVDGALGTYPLKNIHHNHINTINYNSTGDFLGIYANYLGDGGTAQSSSINNNTVTGVTWSGNIFGIYHGILSSPNQKVLIHANEVNNLSSNGIAATVYPLCLNLISNELNVYKNKIHNIQATGVSGVAHGIYVSNAGTTELWNNRVGRVFAPNSGLINPVNGIYVHSGAVVNLKYNTVYLNATGSAANFNSNALYANTATTLNLNNNIFINNSTANGTGINAAYRRSTNNLQTYGSNSNRNVFYAGSLSANNLIYSDPTHSIATLFALQNLLSPRELNSEKENTPFISTLGNSAAFLMVDPVLPSASESGAQNSIGITDDFDGQVRQGNPGYAGTGTAPDIGSDEFNQALPPCGSVNSGTVSPATLTICAGQNITLQSAGYTYTSAGGVVHQWQFSSSAAGPFTTVTGGSPANKTEYTSGALSSGTLYFVLTSTCTNNAQTSVSNQATVVVLASPSASISAATTSLCSGNGIQLNLTTDIGTSFYWLGPSNYTSAVQSPSLSNLSTYNGGVYSVVVTAANACTNAASYSVHVHPSVPAFTYTPSNPAICIGDSILLSASIPISTPTLVFNPQSNQNAANAYPAPYSMYYGGQKMQFIIQSAELSASGFVIGSPITSIEFPVVSLGASWGNTIFHCQDFQISIGHTTLSSITSFQGPLNVVLPAFNFTPVAGGFNTHVFANPFIWDGQSNLIVETLFSNGIFGNAATSVVQYNSPTGYQSTVVYRADNQNLATIAAATSSNVNVGNARPDFRLNGNPVGTYTWTPSLGLAFTNLQLTQASPASTQIYTTVLSNAFCSETKTVQLTVANHPTISIATTASLVCVGNVATLTATGANSFTWNTGASNSLITIAPAGNATYVATGFNQPCPAVSAAVQISVAPAILISAVSSSPVICAGETSTLYANGANSYTWSNGATGSVTVVNPLTNTTYTVFGSSGPGCSAQQALAIISNSLPLVQVSPVSATVCPGETVEYTASGALSYTWLPANLISPNLVVFPQTSATYTLIGQGANQCKATFTVQAIVDPCVNLNEQAFLLQGLNIYPNPSEGKFVLDFELSMPRTLQVYTTDGLLLFNENTDSQQVGIDLTGKAKGMYLLKIQSGVGVYNFKLLLQ